MEKHKNHCHPYTDVLGQKLSVFGFFYTSPPSLHSSIKFIPVHCTDPTSIHELYMENYQVTYLDSCNGLVLGHFLEADTNRSSYIVCNPTMCQHVFLPPLPSVAEGNAVFLVHGFVFVCNDYDKKSPYFEVIRVLQGQEGLIVSTFSSSTWTWTTKNHDELSFLNCSNLNLEGVGVRCNYGSLHWLCLPFGMVSYCVKTKLFSLIKVPGGNGLLKEALGYLFYILISKNYHCSTWVLENIGRTKRWNLKNWVDLRRLPLDVILPNEPCEPEQIYSCILGFDPLDLWEVFVRINRSIVSINVKSREVMEIHRLPEDEIEGVCLYKVMDSIPKEYYSKVLQTPCESQNP